MGYGIATSDFITFDGVTTEPYQEIFKPEIYGITGSYMSKKTVIILDSPSKIKFNNKSFDCLIKDAVEFTEVDFEIYSIKIADVGVPYYIQCYIG